MYAILYHSDLQCTHFYLQDIHRDPALHPLLMDSIHKLQEVELQSVEPNNRLYQAFVDTNQQIVAHTTQLHNKLMERFYALTRQTRMIQQNYQNHINTLQEFKSGLRTMMNQVTHLHNRNTLQSILHYRLQQQFK